MSQTPIQEDPMNTELPLMLRNDASLSLTFTPQAERLKREALELSAAIGKVADNAANLRAVAAQTELVTLIKLVEEARTSAKDPVLKFGRNIDDAAKAFIADLKEEQNRLSQLVGDFHQLEQAKARAEQLKENERLSGMERERQAELATADTHERLDAINEKWDIRMQKAEPSPQLAEKPANQRVAEVIEFEVTDVWALARAHPGCVKIEPRALEIRSALRAGVKLAGVRSWTATKATVRVPTQPKALEI
jgi:hypothetical protein